MSLTASSEEVQIVTRAAERRASPLGADRTDWLVGASVAALAIATVVYASDTRYPFALVNPALDIAIHTIGTVVCITVATLALARYREQGGTGSLLLAAAFLVLFAANLANALSIVLQVDDEVGLSRTAPGQLPLYMWAFARLIAAGLFVAAGAPPVVETIGRLGRPRLVLWAPVTILAAACVGLWLVRDAVPQLIDPATLVHLTSTATRPSWDALGSGLLVLDGMAAFLMMVGAVIHWRDRRDGFGMPRLYLVAGLAVAALSEVHFVLYPGVYTGLVSGGDILRIAFYLILLAGVRAASAGDLSALKRAHVRTQLLAATEADRRAMAERARLARDLHDGLAQDLWTAMLELDRLGSRLAERGVPVEDEMERLRGAVAAANHEARQAVDTLRSGFDPGTSFAQELPRRLEGFTDRTGYPVDLELGPGIERIPSIVTVEALRIVDEALQNVFKHADATLIRLKVEVREGLLLIEIIDNGQGFSLPYAGPGRGLVGMHERAALLGGELSMRTGSGEGTSVLIEIPIEAPTDG